MKRSVGKPLKFEKPEDLLKLINIYFAETEPDKYSVTGLAIIIGSKQLMNDYEKREGYGWMVTKAKLYVENSYELSLRKNGRTGDIFALKNFGWKDTTQTELSTPTGESIKIDTTAEEASAIYQQTVKRGKQ